MDKRVRVSGEVLRVLLDHERTLWMNVVDPHRRYLGNNVYAEATQESIALAEERWREAQVWARKAVAAYFGPDDSPQTPPPAGEEGMG